MKISQKKTKKKSITIRLYEDAYNFIEEKATEQGITKSDYLISQIDIESGFMQFINKESDRLELELQQLKEESKKAENDWKYYWESAPDEDLKLALKTVKDKEKDKINKVIISAAKKRGFVS